MRSLYPVELAACYVESYCIFTLIIGVETDQLSLHVRLLMT